MDLQQYMDSEIRAIMAQYMPLDSQPEVPNHANDERAWESEMVHLFISPERNQGEAFF